MKASIVLGVIALCLLGFIVFYERGTLGTRDVETRKGQVLPELIRARVVKLEVQKKGTTMVLERKLEGTDEEMLWSVKAPYQAEADQDSVDTLLGDLEWLYPKRTLRDVGAEDLEKFGLTKPRFRAWFTIGSQRIALKVGNETPQRDGIYMTASEPGTVFVVGKDFAESLGQPAVHYHTKTLHEGVLVSTARKIEVRDAAGQRVVVRDKDGLWKIAEPATSKDMLAASAEVTTLIEATDELKATRFVTTENGALPRYGLDPAQLDVSIHKRAKIDMKNTGDEGGIVLAVRVRAGAPCEGHATERYVTIGDSGSVFCAQSADLEKLKLPEERVREARLLPIDPGDVKGVRLVRGDRSLLIERVGGIPQVGEAEPWRYEQKRGDKIIAQGAVRDGAQRDFLDALRAAVALPDVVANGTVQGATFSATFLRDENKPDLVFQIGLRGLDEALVQRQGEPQPLVFAPSAVELLDPSIAPFKSLSVLALNEADLRALDITRDGVTEHAERADAGAPFTISKPVQLEADRIATADIARLLSTLQAVRFVADAPEPVHQLDAPVAMVHARYAARGEIKAQTLGLRLGAATEGGYFAKLDSDPAVFVVSTQLGDLLKAPLASRTLLAVPLESLAAIDIAQAGRKVRVQRAGAGFEIAGKAGDAPQNAAAQSLARVVATLRAITVSGYGEPAAEQGFKPPFATLRLERTSGEPLEIVLGGQAPNGDRYARRRDVAATLLLPASSADALIAPLR
jgi:hypothetical protein